MTNFKNQLTNLEWIVKQYSQEFWGIFKYERNWEFVVNTNLFWDALNIWEQELSKLLETIDVKFREIKQLKKQIYTDKEISELERNFLINTINFKWLRFILLKNSAYLEAEKAWFKLNALDRKKYLRRVNILQDILYGKNLSDNPETVEKIVEHLKNLFINNSSKLDDTEKDLFEQLLKWNSVLLEWKKIQNSEKTEKLPIDDKKISKSDAKNILRMVMDLYWLLEWKIEEKDVWNFTVNKLENSLFYPQKVSEISLKRLLQLIDHEIWVHMIRNDNSFKTLNINWEWYLEWEEWLATISENLFSDTIKNTENTITITEISSWLAENYDFKDTLSFLILYFKITNDWDKTEQAIYKDAFDRALRTKRFVSLYEKWSNRKDISYSNWREKIIDVLKKWNDTKQFLLDFYFSKLSLDDLKFVSDFKKELEINNQELKYPIWVWKILYKKLIWDKVFLDKLKLQDNRFDIVEKLSNDNKRKIVKILEYIKKL